MSTWLAFGWVEGWVGVSEIGAAEAFTSTEAFGVVSPSSSVGGELGEVFDGGSSKGFEGLGTGSRADSTDVP
jgi:hypothetical protein